MNRPENFLGEFVLTNLDGYVIGPCSEDTKPQGGQVVMLWNHGRYIIYRTNMDKSCAAQSQS